VVKLLLADNVNIHLCENNSRSPLHIACESGHTEVVRLLADNPLLSQCIISSLLSNSIFTTSACSHPHAAYNGDLP
jgi:ankyrin repeat protein